MTENQQLEIEIRHEIIELEADMAMQHKIIMDANEALNRFNALNLLQGISEYKLLISDGYLTDYADEQVRKLARSGDAQHTSVVRTIEGVSQLRRYLDDIIGQGQMAPNVIANAENEILALQKAIDEKYEAINSLHE